MKFRKKPIVIEAMQWLNNGPAIIAWIGHHQAFFKPPVIVIRTLEGDTEASPGDWIIKGVKGEFYPCKPDIFEATYEEVES